MVMARGSSYALRLGSLQKLIGGRRRRPTPHGLGY
jgi:hypothetical protein